VVHIVIVLVCGTVQEVVVVSDAMHQRRIMDSLETDEHRHVIGVTRYVDEISWDTQWRLNTNQGMSQKTPVFLEDDDVSSVGPGADQLTTEL